MTASRLAEAGWLVLPGAWWSALDRRHRCELTDCLVSSLHPAPVGCHNGVLVPPIHHDLATHALTSSDQARSRWSHRPYAVLALTGRGVDVIDAPLAAAHTLAHRLQSDRIPTLAAVVDGRGLIFVAPGDVIDQERRSRWARYGVVYHQHDSWVAVPPSLVDGIPSRWLSRASLRRSSLTPADAVTVLLDQAADDRGFAVRGTDRVTGRRGPRSAHVVTRGSVEELPP